MRRTLCIRSRNINMDEQVDAMLHEQFLRVIDIAGMDYSPVDKKYSLVLLVEEQETPLRQGIVGFTAKKTEDLVKDINDYCEVMAASHSISFVPRILRFYRLQSPEGTSVAVAYMVYSE